MCVECMGDWLVEGEGKSVRLTCFMKVAAAPHKCVECMGDWLVEGEGKSVRLTCFMKVAAAPHTCVLSVWVIGWWRGRGNQYV